MPFVVSFFPLSVIVFKSFSPSVPKVNGYGAETSGSKLRQAGVEEEEEELQTELRS